MRIEDLHSALHTEPFQPFRLHLADGRAVDVHQPKVMHIPSHDARTFIVTHRNGVPEWIDPLHVSSLQPLNTADA